MKSFSLIVLIALVSVLSEKSCAMDAKNLLAIATECKSLEKATEMDFFNLKMNIKGKTKTMKCLAACLFEKFGTIKNKKLDVEAVLKEMKATPKITPEMQKSIGELLNECSRIKETDRCEFASKILDCLTDGATKRGIKPEPVP